jgi:PBP1b-binding outer membrane lipoprotein LpoB
MERCIIKIIKNKLEAPIMELKQSVKLFGFILLTFAILFVGCGKQEEKKQEEKPKTETTKTDTTTNKTVEQPAQQQAPAIADIKGTYSGVFDSRPTTLVITEQTDKAFKGKITINYREVINQEVSGEFNPETKTVTMKDMLHSRYAGKYTGKLSDDLKKFSGTFTMNVDGNKLNFNLVKK